MTETDSGELEISTEITYACGKKHPANFLGKKGGSGELSWHCPASGEDKRIELPFSTMVFHAIDGLIESSLLKEALETSNTSN